jgi:diadenosine tetraphosphatase ApaH/serine/threonine PP2A family protein phosphatase
MRYGILADVHANHDALQAVFEDAQDVDEWYFLGDAVGYGPHPVETLRLLRKKVKLSRWLLGNHDAMLVNILDDDVNEGASKSLVVHHRLLAEARLLDWCREKWTLKRMNPKRVIELDGECWLVHGSSPGVGPKEPNPLRQYLFPWPDHRDGVDYGKEEFRVLSFVTTVEPQVLIHGHTHVPYARGIYQKERMCCFLPICYRQPIFFDEFSQLLICPGSVGQPRNPDPDPHAAYGVVDTQARSFEFRKVLYDSEPTRVKISRLGIDNTEKVLQSYLMGAFPDHKFWQDNPLWNEWIKIYRFQEWGWEVLTDPVPW